jgi:ABC-type transport system involved in cytochrome bd biosynthesis fused ATPase/permease subunit
MAKPDATDGEIRTACDNTELWPILERNLGPDPLDQQFAAGRLLSGGQKKLFALTRCLMLDPTVLLLDEPTVGMGPLEKFPLIETMRKACLGKTAMVVDHDIVWQVQFCDLFLVLDDAKIVQQGTSEELLAQPGLFRELYEEATGAGPGSRTVADGRQHDVGMEELPMTGVPRWRATS